MDSKERRSQLQGKLRERVTRGRCNFTLPKPFVILSSKGLKRNGFRRAIREKFIKEVLDEKQGSPN